MTLPPPPRTDALTAVCMGDRASAGGDKSHSSGCCMAWRWQFLLGREGHWAPPVWTLSRLSQPPGRWWPLQQTVPQVPRHQSRASQKRWLLPASAPWSCHGSASLCGLVHPSFLPFFPCSAMKNHRTPSTKSCSTGVCLIRAESARMQFPFFKTRRNKGFQVAIDPSTT